MVETRCALNWLYWQLYLNRNLSFTKATNWIKFPLLSLATLLAVGCSTTSTQQLPPSSLTEQPKNKVGALHGSFSPLENNASPKSELAVPDHPSIDSWTIYYTEKKQKSFQTLLKRAEVYVLPVQEIFEDRGLPKDLAYVALVESGFCPTARSSANAVGMWQFISATGKRFGLEQNRWVDERRHPFKSAQAAAEYLSVLYDQFGSWELALAAYNAGENAVQAALDQSGLSTFWELRQNGYLPSETRDYVPKFFATVRIIRNATQYGFLYEPKPYDPQHETVTVPGGTKLAWLGEKIGVDASVLKKYNPELCSATTPPIDGYSLCVPVGKSDTVLAVLTDRSNETRSDETVEVTVKEEPDRPKNTWSKESEKVGSASSVKKDPKPLQIASARPAKDTPPRGVKVNPASVKQSAQDYAQLPQATRVAKVSQASLKQNSNSVRSISTAQKNSSRPEPKSQTVIFYPVHRGDTIESLANRFQVSVNTLCATNKLTRTQKLTPGNTLIICTDEHDSGRSEKKRAD